MPSRCSGPVSSNVRHINAPFDGTPSWDRNSHTRASRLGRAAEARREDSKSSNSYIARSIKPKVYMQWVFKSVPTLKENDRCVQKGSRSFFCNSCHSKWRETNPANPAVPRANAKSKPSEGTANVGRSAGNSDVRSSFNQNIRQTPIQSGSGCLGATLLIIAIPIVLIAIGARYA